LWWKISIKTNNFVERTSSLLKLKGSKCHKSVTYAIFVTLINHIWILRYFNISNGRSSKDTIFDINEHIKQRFLFLNTINKKYDVYMDIILS